MNYLIDTHVLIYIGTGEIDQIGEKAFDTYQHPANKISISQISFLEIAIKINIGKLVIPIGLSNMIIKTREVGIEIIPIKNSHLVGYVSLPVMTYHKDPFDRLIVSTAIDENLSILSSDRNFDLYEGINRIWK